MFCFRLLSLAFALRCNDEINLLANGIKRLEDCATRHASSLEYTKRRANGVSAFAEKRTRRQMAAAGRFLI
jgi:hypothetical protein